VSRVLSLAAALAMGGAGFWAGTHRPMLDPYVAKVVSLARIISTMPKTADAKPATGPVIYYRDPDGRPAWSLVPKTADGKVFVPVLASEDVGVEPATPEAMAMAAPEPSGSAEAPGKIKFYRNPMGLPDTSPVPKKDSMGMDYIPVFEGDGDDGKVIKVSPGKLQRTGVRSEAVEKRRIVQTIRVPGTVQWDERRVSVVATRSDAFVDGVMSVTTGDRVKKGQALVKIYSPDINAAAAQFLSNPGFEGSRRRLKNLNVSDQAIADMERTRLVPTAVVWSAPSDGIVLERGAVDGMKASAGATLFRIADTAVVWTMAEVPERDMASVRVGQPVTVRIRSRPGRTFTGHVDVIYPQINTATRSTRVRTELPNPDGLLLADMYADVSIETGTPEPVVAVPDDAVIDTGTRQSVILDRGAGRLEPREVKVGVRGDGYVEIKEGVEPGDLVVMSANFLIDAESNLKAALEGLAAANTAAAAKAP
jgi:Cu(I)/Ag(I) efflux system membrane fusion protein